MKRFVFSLLTFATLTNISYAQSWDDIPTDSRVMLKPLRSTWEELPTEQRQQWLARTSQLQSLQPQQLATAHERMAEWASLSQKQRSLVQRKLVNDGVNNPNTRAKSWNSFINLK